MTSYEFMSKIFLELNSQDYHITFSPTKTKDYMMNCNRTFIGGLFDEELFFLFSQKVSDMLDNPEPAYHGYSKNALHKMLPVPIAMAKPVISAMCKKSMEAECAYVYDVAKVSRGAAVIEDFYDENVIFLRFCFDNELLKHNPLDRKGRIIQMEYLQEDLTRQGKKIFQPLLDKFLTFTDNHGKTSLEKMFPRWFAALTKE